jgi:holo-[acyl-carrier protein] synthase
MQQKLPLGALAFRFGTYAGEVIGIGTDLVDIDRFRIVLDRTPGIRTRTFTEAERTYADARNDPTERYAVRWAAKEAVMKAMGVGLGAVAMIDIEVVRAESGAPSIVLHGSAADLSTEMGITEWKITLTHSETLAQAIAVAL